MPDKYMRSAGHRHVRTLFLSDLHLGARGCRAEPILEFLRSTEADTIFLIGDILDIWHCGKVQWGPTHDAIMDELRSRARHGTRVVYLPGNHDAVLRKRLGHMFDGLELVNELTHVAADGTRYLVLHGDQCDARILRWHVMTRIGSRADAWLRGFDDWARRTLRRTFHREPERNLVELLISGVNMLTSLGNRFEERLTTLARETGHDGVICGHFHKPALHQTDGVIYANCGDWVDSLTALAEARDGTLVLLDWRAATVSVSDAELSGTEVRA